MANTSPSLPDAWVFNCNPVSSYAREAIAAGELGGWSVINHKAKIKAGDCEYMWTTFPP